MKTPELDLLESADQKDLRATVRKAVTAQSERNPEAGVGEPWRFTTADLGLFALAIDEDLDGVGLGARELGVVAEELGRGLAAPAFLTSAVVATEALLAADRSATGSLLTELASGAKTAVLVVSGPTSPTDDFPQQVTASGTGQQVQLSGTVEVVPGASWADLFVVPAILDGEPVLVAVDGADQVQVDEQVSLDQTRPVSNVTFTDTAGFVIAHGAQARAAVASALDLGAAVLSAERVGIMEWTVAKTAEYLGQRYQFGQLIGSYQALRHANARMWLDTTQARAITAHALAALTDDPEERELATSMAAAYTAPRALRNVEQAQQLHGGIGFAWEHPIHWYLKRAMANSVLFGPAEQHRIRIGQLTDLI